jgi:hypothetical protein
MADKWADYVITAVRFNAAGTHIESVQVRQDDGETISAATTTTSRSEVVRLLEAGYTFCTATMGNDGKWNKGAAVKIVEIDDQKFIRTKADGTKSDNLDNLPTF